MIYIAVLWHAMQPAEAKRGGGRKQASCPVLKGATYTAAYTATYTGAYLQHCLLIAELSIIISLTFSAPNSSREFGCGSKYSLIVTYKLYTCVLSGSAGRATIA